MDVEFFDKKGNVMRCEQWILDENGNPETLMFESVVKVIDGEEYYWFNSGGHIEEKRYKDILGTE